MTYIYWHRPMRRRGEVVLQERAFLVFDPSSQRARQWMVQAARSPAARAETCPNRRAILCHGMAFQALYAKVGLLQPTKCPTGTCFHASATLLTACGNS